MSLSTAYANIGKANRKKDDYDMRTKVISGAMGDIRVEKDVIAYKTRETG